MWNENRLTKRLMIDYPVIQAGMAGGPTTPELVAAVSNAGGLGTLGAGYMQPEAIRSAVRTIRGLTHRPFGVNLFIPPDEISTKPEAVDRMRTALQALAPDTLDIPEPSNTTDYSEQFQRQLAVVMEERVPVFSFTFGILPADEMRQLQEIGTVVIGSATTVAEAIALEETGVDAIVCQGSEAGGHRGTFLADAHSPFVGTMALIPQVADHVRVPVIAAGGIMDARGIVASLALGADGVQMGTAFLPCLESGAHPRHKEAVLHSKDSDTVMIDAFSGKPARGIYNRFIAQMKHYDGDIPAYPLQNTLTRPLRNWASQADNPEYMSLWAGQAAGLSKQVCAADLMRELVSGATQLLEHLH